jgi:uncharacterized protein (DUF1697 family)
MLRSLPLSRPPPTPKRYVALFRGLSLGKKQLPMGDLVAMFVRQGCKDVRHYIRSGNVVFGASPELAEKIPTTIALAIQAEFGFESPVVLRTVEEMSAVVRKHPLQATGVDEKVLHVGFLSSRPAPAKVATLDASRSPPDTFVVRGREIYLRLPNGVAKSRLTNAYFDSKLGIVSTFRNWRTVLTLAQMAKEP